MKQPLAPCPQHWPPHIVQVWPGPGEWLLLAATLYRTSLCHMWVSPVCCGGVNHIWGTQLSFCCGGAALWIAVFWWWSPLNGVQNHRKAFYYMLCEWIASMYPHFPTSAELYCILSRKTGTKYLNFFFCYRQSHSCIPMTNVFQRF